MLSQQDAHLRGYDRVCRGKGRVGAVLDVRPATAAAALLGAAVPCLPETPIWTPQRLCVRSYRSFSSPVLPSLRRDISHFSNDGSIQFKVMVWRLGNVPACSGKDPNTFIFAGFWPVSGKEVTPAQKKLELKIRLEHFFSPVKAAGECSSIHKPCFAVPYAWCMSRKDLNVSPRTAQRFHECLLPVLL